MRLKLIQRDEIQGFDMGAFEHHWRSNACIERFLPAAGTQAPAVACYKTSKAVFGAGGHEVVATLEREDQELLRHARAHHMRAMIVLIGVAAAIAVIAGERVIRTRHERFAEYVFGGNAHGLFARHANLRHLHGRGNQGGDLRHVAGHNQGGGGI
jgi:hypothetical protein